MLDQKFLEATKVFSWNKPFFVNSFGKKLFSNFEEFCNYCSINLGTNDLPTWGWTSDFGYPQVDFSSITKFNNAKEAATVYISSLCEKAGVSDSSSLNGSEIILSAINAIINYKINDPHFKSLQAFSVISQWQEAEKRFLELNENQLKTWLIDYSKIWVFDNEAYAQLKEAVS